MTTGFVVFVHVKFLNTWLTAASPLVDYSRMTRSIVILTYDGALDRRRLRASLVHLLRALNRFVVVHFVHLRAGEIVQPIADATDD